MTDETPTTDTDVTTTDTGPEAVATGEPGAAVTDPDELMKQKYRDAMAHKHGASGAAKKAHGDAGTSGHSQSTGPTQKLFRRKAGG